MAPTDPRRPTCSVFIATSVDGYIARSDGSVDWLDAVARPGEDYGYRAFVESVDALVMGRNTYDTAAGKGAWPYEGTPVVVLTRRPATERDGVTFLEDRPERLIERLAGRGARSWPSRLCQLRYRVD